MKTKSAFQGAPYVQDASSDEEGDNSDDLEDLQDFSDDEEKEVIAKTAT